MDTESRRTGAHGWCATLLQTFSMHGWGFQLPLTASCHPFAMLQVGTTSPKPNPLCLHVCFQGEVKLHATSCCTTSSQGKDILHLGYRTLDWCYSLFIHGYLTYLANLVPYLYEVTFPLGQVYSCTSSKIHHNPVLKKRKLRHSYLMSMTIWSN